MSTCAHCGRDERLRSIRGIALCASCAEEAARELTEGHAPSTCYRCGQQAHERTLINGGGVRDICHTCLRRSAP